jgi:pilus assembly protein CpaC
MKSLKAKMLLASLAVAPLTAVPTTTATAQQVDRPAQDVVLSIGRGQLISVPGTMADVFVANEAVADVQIKSQRELYVFAKAGGETTIYASNAAGNVIWSANVRVGSNIDSVDQMLALAMPDAKVGVATMGTNTVLLTGTVGAPEDAAEAERLVQAFLGTETNVISRLKTAVPLQVNLKVTFAEVSRSLVREIGANLTSADSGPVPGVADNGFKFGVGSGRSAVSQYTPGGPAGVNVTEGASGTTVIESVQNGTTLAGLGRLFGLDLAGTLDLAENIGLVTTLSEPNLTALSGETATFLAGGEFPIPISQGLGNVSIEFRKYGVSLAYTPTVLANGRISMRVRPEVSELSNQGAVTLNGFVVPALTIRRTETTIELGSGQSFMIAGLMSNNSQQLIDKAPGLGDIPILGNLFRSRAFRKGETELVIIVTPYLVKPVDAKDIKLPTDGFRSANEVQQLIGFRSNAGESGAQRPGPTASDATAATPGISSADDQPVVPYNPPKQQRAEKADKKKKKDRSTDVAAAPGFSL